MGIFGSPDSNGMCSDMYYQLHYLRILESTSCHSSINGSAELSTLVFTEPYSIFHFTIEVVLEDIHLEPKVCHDRRTISNLSCLLHSCTLISPNEVNITAGSFLYGRGFGSGRGIVTGSSIVVRL
jgi:hypothetical protein